MATGTHSRSDRPALITDARESSTYDASRRTRRYLASMGVRVVCFIGGCLSPSPWNWVLFAGSAIIPPIAVLLANAIDQRGLGQRQRRVDPGTRPALPSSSVVPGSVEE